MDFAPFDRRGYPTLPVREGYAAWAETYDATVLDEMDIRLLERIETVVWTQAHAVDLACGTGRIGAWLRAKRVASLVGVDFTPEMSAHAQQRHVYDHLVRADIVHTGLAPGSFDLVTQSLADEHLADLRPLYAEAARLSRAGGAFAIAGYHPHFLMSGVPAHFNGPRGASIAVESYVHLMSDHVHAARASGWRLDEMHEGLIDDAWIARKPKWSALRHHPVSFALVWRR